MQELETWRKLPLIHYTLPPPPTPFELYRNVRRIFDLKSRAFWELNPETIFEQTFIFKTRCFALVWLTWRRLSFQLTRTKVFPSAGKKTLFSCKFCKKETSGRSPKAVMPPSCKPRYESVLVILQLVSSKKLTKLLLCKFQNLDFVQYKR